MLEGKGGHQGSRFQDQVLDKPQRHPQEGHQRLQGQVARNQADFLALKAGQPHYRNGGGKKRQADDKIPVHWRDAQQGHGKAGDPDHRGQGQGHVNHVHGLPVSQGGVRQQGQQQHGVAGYSGNGVVVGGDDFRGGNPGGVQP